MVFFLFQVRGISLSLLDKMMFPIKINNYNLKETKNNIVVLKNIYIVGFYIL